MGKSEKVAVIDDDKRSRERVSDFLESVGFEPILYDQRIQSLEELRKDLITQGIRYSICDHRLREKNYANFLGAVAVAKFYESEIIPILMTGYAKDDADTTIRPYRKNIPVLLHNKRVSPENLKSSFAIARREVVDKIIPRERQPCRSIMTVTDIFQEGHTKLVKVILAQWDPSQEVGFPSTMLPSEIQEIIKPETMLLANVNVDAEEPEDLFFENFSLPDEHALKSI